MLCISCGNVSLLPPRQLQQTYRLANDLVVRSIFNGLPDFLVTSIGSNDAVLPLHLRRQLVSEVSINLLIFIDGGLQFPIHKPDLRSVPWVARLFLLLDRLDTSTKAAVEGHGVGAEGIELSICGGGLARVRIVNGSLLQKAKTFQVALNRIDAPVDVATLVKDGVGVACGRCCWCRCTVSSCLSIDGPQFYITSSSYTMLSVPFIHVSMTSAYHILRRRLSAHIRPGVDCLAVVVRWGAHILVRRDSLWRPVGHMGCLRTDRIGRLAVRMDWPHILQSCRSLRRIASRRAMSARIDIQMTVPRTKGLMIYNN